MLEKLNFDLVLKNSQILIRKNFQNFFRKSDRNIFMIIGICILDSKKLSINEWGLGSDSILEKMTKGGPLNFWFRTATFCFYSMFGAKNKKLFLIRSIARELEYFFRKILIPFSRSEIKASDFLHFTQI